MQNTHCCEETRGIVYLENIGEKEEALVVMNGISFTTGKIQEIIVDLIGLIGETRFDQVPDGVDAKVTVEVLLSLLRLISLEDTVQPTELDRWICIRTLDYIKTRNRAGEQFGEEPGTLVFVGKLQAIQALLKG